MGLIGCKRRSRNAGCDRPQARLPENWKTVHLGGSRKSAAPEWARLILYRKSAHRPRARATPGEWFGPQVLPSCRSHDAGRRYHGIEPRFRGPGIIGMRFLLFASARALRCSAPVAGFPVTMPSLYRERAKSPAGGKTRAGGACSWIRRAAHGLSLTGRFVGWRKPRAARVSQDVVRIPQAISRPDGRTRTRGPSSGSLSADSGTDVHLR